MPVQSESETIVDLWSARIPGLGRFAEHHWLVVCRQSTADRWEVWQTASECETSWGHLHRNLLRPSSGVGNGPGRIIERWTGDDAVYLASRIEASPTAYPWHHRYRVFPGPNSNTYVQWVLGPLYTLGWRGFGRRYANSIRLAKTWANHDMHGRTVCAVIEVDDLSSVPRDVQRSSTLNTSADLSIAVIQ